MNEKLVSRDSLDPKIGWWNKPTTHETWWAALGVVLIIAVFVLVVL